MERGDIIDEAEAEVRAAFENLADYSAEPMSTEEFRLALGRLGVDVEGAVKHLGMPLRQTLKWWWGEASCEGGSAQILRMLLAEPQKAALFSLPTPAAEETSTPPVATKEKAQGE